MKVTLIVNGSPVETDVNAGDTLLDTLRRLGFTSVKDGCANGDCGTCAVLVDGRAVTSCLMFAGQAEDRTITTLEGLGRAGEALHPLQQALLDAGGVQCGYCIPGMILTAADLITHHPNPTRSEIESYLAGNLCRCTGYVKQVEAIERAAEVLQETDHG